MNISRAMTNVAVNLIDNNPSASRLECVYDLVVGARVRHFQDNLEHIAWSVTYACCGGTQTRSMAVAPDHQLSVPHSHDVPADAN